MGSRETAILWTKNHPKSNFFLKKDLSCMSSDEYKFPLASSRTPVYDSKFFTMPRDWDMGNRATVVRSSPRLPRHLAMCCPVFLGT